MKLAISTEGNRVAEHFGRCPEYTIVRIENGKVKDKVVVPNPGHEPGFLPAFLSRMGVGCIIAGGMGPRAQGLFAGEKIETVVGVGGTVDQAVEQYLAGTLEGGASCCDHGSEGHHDCHQG
jgi:predicted Fe-Mo cluster-binding NifX family protein